MNNPQILSTPQRRKPGAALPPPTALLVFDACEVGVVLRAVLSVQTVLGAGLMYGADSLSAWLERLASVTAASLPATLLWLLLGCALKRPLARLNLSTQVAVGVALGGLAGVLAIGLLGWVQWPVGPAPLLLPAAALTGALLAMGVVLGLVWRARGRMPAATQARLSELQARIRPHFLFNTLNSAIALVREDPARAETMLEDLADLFRHALTEAGDSATLAQELELARRYLDIEQVRFGDRLRVRWSLDERADQASLPPLILQPLVENAVIHGVEPSAEGADIRVATRLRGDTVVLEVSNSLLAAPSRSTAGHGIAQANVRARLKLLHDVQASFRAGVAEGRYIARIKVPLAPKLQVPSRLPGVTGDKR